MKRLALVMLVALASTAGAADKYVTTTGAGTHDGSSAGNAYTLAEANAAAAAGTRFLLASGTYATAINPATGTLTTSRISYVPTATSAVDTTVIVAGISLKVPGVTVRGIKSSAALLLEPTGRLRTDYPSGDSVVSCVVTSGGMAVNGAKASVIYGNTINGLVSFQRYAFNRACSSGACDTLTWPSNDSLTVRRNNFWVGQYTVADNSSGDYRAFSFWAYTRRTTVDSNTVMWQTDEVGGGTAHSPALYWLANVSNLTFRDNHTTIKSTFTNASVSRGATTYAYYLRDSTSDCTWTRDTTEAVVSGTTGPVTAEWGGQGSFNAALMKRNTFNQCVLKLNGNFVFNDTPTAFRMVGCLVASHDGQLVYTQSTALDSLWLTNNTFYGASSRRLIGEEKKVPPFANSHWRKNLFLSRSNSSSCSTDGSMSCIHGDPSYVFSDSNAYYSYAGSEAFSMLQESAGCNTLAGWYAANGNEQHSVWVSPSVHDTAWATLNLRPLTFSSPLLTTFSGAYIGAYSDTGSTSGGGSGPWTITASAGSSGSISPSGAVSVVNGTSQAFSITPATNYHVWDVLVDGASVGAVTTYTFINVTASHTISCTFATTDPPITPGRQLINATCNCPN